MFLNVFLPAVIWMTAVANGLAFASAQSGWALYASFAAVIGFSACSAFYAWPVTELHRKGVGKGGRVIVYGMALVGVSSQAIQLFRPGFLLDTDVAVTVASRKPVTVDLDRGIKMYVPPSPHRSPDLPSDLLGAIARGKRMMGKASFDQDKCLGEGEGFRKCLGSYLLAAVDKDGALQKVDVMRKPDGTFVSTPPSFSVDRESGEGFNTAFRVSSPPGWTVVALRRPYTKDGNVVADTYVPYSAALNTDELVTEGARYLGLMLTSASRELEARQVESKFIPGKLVTDIGTNDHVAALVMTEWVRDPEAFVTGTAAERAEFVARTLAMFGANRGRAFRFSQSAVGASGIAQVMPATASGIVDQYDDAGLAGFNDFDRSDHQQALKLSIIHADAELWTFGQNKARLGELTANPAAFRLVLASGYNCNAQYVDAVIQSRGDDWRKPCGKEAGACSDLPLETRNYLVKYEEIYGLLFDRATHDRVAAIVSPPVVAETKTE
ncbi:MAG: hypothetical protein WCO25_02910 [Candidatus Uhrbacteria bacterium]